MADAASQLDTNRKTFLDLVRARFVQIFSKTTRIKDLTLEKASISGVVHAHHMSVIILSGHTLHLVLKAHYNTEDAKKALAARWSSSSEAIEYGDAVGFMSETLNVVAGSIKASLFDQTGLTMGISIPFLTAGFDELLMKRHVDSDILRDAFTLSWKEGFLTVSSELKVLDSMAIDHTNFDCEEVVYKSEVYF